MVQAKAVKSKFKFPIEGVGQGGAVVQSGQ